MLAPFLALMLLQVSASDPALPPLSGKDVKVVFASQAPANLRFYPKPALDREAEGSADVLCRIAQDQRLVDCAPVSEEPAGLGFGEAAVKMFSLMRAEPVAKDGSRTAGRQIALHFHFKLDRQAR